MRKITDFKREAVEYYFQALGYAFKNRPKQVIVLFLLAMITGSIPIVSLWNSKIIFDLLVYESSEPLTTFWTQDLLPRILFQFLLSVSSFLINQGRGYLSTLLSKDISQSMELDIYKKVNSLHGLATFEHSNFQNTLQLGLTTGLSSVPQAVSLVIQITNGIVSLIGVMISLLSYNVLLAVGLFLLGLPYLFAELNQANRRHRLVVENTPLHRNAGYYTFLLASTYFVKDIKLFNLGDHFLNLLHKEKTKIKAIEVQQVRIELFTRSTFQLLTNVINSAIYLYLSYQVVFRNFTIGDLVLITGLTGRTQGALSSFFLSLASVPETGMNYSKYLEIQYLPQSIKLCNDPQEPALLTQGIQFKNVSFRYSPDSNTVLHNLNITVPAGKTLAIVGVNGSGKTTLIKLLCRLYDPSAGEILWDGQNINEFSLLELRKRIGVIFQDFIHFDLSATMNIGVGSIEHIEEKEKIIESAKMAGIHQRLLDLPEGYDTVLSQWLRKNGSGSDLSGGEWQKIALARLLLKNAEIVILDEPTSSLDAQSEYDIYKKFKSFLKDKTCILISHRLNIARLADYIAIVENGEITEYGSHAELLEKHGTYAHLYQLQAEMYSE